MFHDLMITSGFHCFVTLCRYDFEKESFGFPRLFADLYTWAQQILGKSSEVRPLQAEGIQMNIGSIAELVVSPPKDPRSVFCLFSQT